MKRLLLLAGLATGVASAAPPPIKAGLWEITTRMEMPGLPQLVPPVTVQHCYKGEDIKDLRATIPKQSSCKVADWQQSGNKINWKMTCSGEMAGTMTGNMTYAGDTYSGTADITMKQAGQTMQMTHKYQARRIGDCK